MMFWNVATYKLFHILSDQDDLLISNGTCASPVACDDAFVSALQYIMCQIIHWVIMHPKDNKEATV
jgi:hypothetical protein